MIALQRFLFEGLIRKQSPLTGKEIRFLRKFLEMSTTELGKKLGLSHATIVKWEKGESQISPSQETYLRLFFCECFKYKEILSIFKDIRPEMLVATKQEKHPHIQVKAKELSAMNF